MSFNSFQYIFGFLPATLLLFYTIGRAGRLAAQSVLVIASLVFCYSWNAYFPGLLVVSVMVNYGLGRIIGPAKNPVWLVAGICFNVGLIAYFKYANLILATVDGVFHASLSPLSLLLPIGISYYTFQQIGYLVERRRGAIAESNLTTYIPFVVFFPQLIAGPIVKYEEVATGWRRISEFARGEAGRSILTGLFLFAIGLFKKMAIADTFGDIGQPVFDAPDKATPLLAWRAALSFTLQIYFDFSGLVDMAVGSARMFGLVLPHNFDSPYKASSLSEFWRRWHITLSRFLRDYIYIPLGGNRRGWARQMLNLMLTMLIGGLWHGASWTFVLWGGIHGAYLVINHFLQQISAVRVNRVVGVSITFLAILIAWVPFRAETFRQTWVLWGKMANLPAAATELLSAARRITMVDLKDPAAWAYDRDGLVWCILAAISLLIVWGARNAAQLAGELEQRFSQKDGGNAGILRSMAWAGALFGISILLLNSGKISKFLYAQY